MASAALGNAGAERGRQPLSLIQWLGAGHCDRCAGGTDARLGPPYREFLDPLLEIFRNTAALALLPVFTLILGIGETSKIAMVLYASVWPILLNTVNAVRTVDPLLVKAARSMGLSSARFFIKVILPASVPT